MFTGQISSHARHVVHAHSSSAVIRSNSELAVIVMLVIGADRRRHDRRAGGRHHLAGLEHDLAWIERLAGGVGRAHARAPPAHRAGVGVEQLLPREVLHHRRAERLQLGLGEVGHRLHRPLRPGRVSRRYMFSGDVNMWRSIVTGRMARKTTNAATWPIHVHWCTVSQRRRRPAVDERAERIADEAPALEVHVRAARRRLGDAHRLGDEAGQADRQQHAEDQGVLGAGLDADAVRPLHVAAGDGDQQAADERHAGEVTDEGVGLVRAAVQELEALRQLVVDLEHGGDAEQHEEAEVDQRVHEPGGRVAQQRAHVHAGAEVAEAALGVGGGGAPGRGGPATLPVLHPVGEAERPPHEHDRDHACRRRPAAGRGCRRTPHG